MTTEQEILEGNKLIAEFMGYEYIGWNDERHRASDYTSGYWGKKHAKLHALKVSGSMMFNPLKYHSSWDWLMPVVEKISHIKYDDLDTAYPRTFGMLSPANKSMFRYNRHKLIEADTLIEAAWIATVEFIRHLNQQP